MRLAFDLGIYRSSKTVRLLHFTGVMRSWKSNHRQNNANQGHSNRATQVMQAFIVILFGPAPVLCPDRDICTQYEH